MKEGGNEGALGTSLATTASKKQGNNLWTPIGTHHRALVPKLKAAPPI